MAWAGIGKKTGPIIEENWPLVGEKGLEPPRYKALVPKTSVSTNSTTRPLDKILILKFMVIEAPAPSLRYHLTS